jgi:hypothetical protein
MDDDLSLVFRTFRHIETVAPKRDKFLDLGHAMPMAFSLYFTLQRRALATQLLLWNNIH